MDADGRNWSRLQPPLGVSVRSLRAHGANAVLQPKPTKGKMRIHCLENVDKALQFLKEQRVHLENMGSHDIVDGNHRLVLGLIWTIILRFQVGSKGAEGVEGALRGQIGLRNLIKW